MDKIDVEYCFELYDVIDAMEMRHRGNSIIVKRMNIVLAVDFVNTA